MVSGVPSSRRAALEGPCWSSFVIYLNIPDFFGNYSIKYLMINYKIGSKKSFQRVNLVLRDCAAFHAQVPLVAPAATMTLAGALVSSRPRGSVSSHTHTAHALSATALDSAGRGGSPRPRVPGGRTGGIQGPAPDACGVCGCLPPPGGGSGEGQAVPGQAWQDETLCPHPGREPACPGALALTRGAVLVRGGGAPSCALKPRARPPAVKRFLHSFAVPGRSGGRARDAGVL